MDITVGIPAYNEEKNIASIIVKLKKIAQKLGAIVINHPKNLGYGSGIRSIFQKAKEIDSDILVTFDADGQHQVEDIKKVIEPILKNKADIVIGSRFLENKNVSVPEYRKIGIKLITKVTNSTLKEKITDSQSGFRAYNKDVLSKLEPGDIGMGISTEILIKASSRGFKIAEVPINILYEGNTSSHNPVSHGTSVLLSTIKYISIEHPLKFYGIPSLIFFAIGLTFTFLSVQYYAEIGRLNTNLTLVAAGTILIGIILIITTILLYSLVSVVREGKTR